MHPLIAFQSWGVPHQVSFWVTVAPRQRISHQGAPWWITPVIPTRAVRKGVMTDRLFRVLYLKVDCRRVPYNIISFKIISFKH